MTTKFFYIFILILLTCLTTFAQHRDYKIYRDSITKLSCKPFDSLTVAQTVYQLKNVDTTNFDSNLNLYYRNLAWSYFRLYLHTKDTLQVKNAIDNYLKVADINKDFWNLSFCYFILNDCSNGNFYLKKYKDNTDKKYWKDEEIKRMTAKCKS